MGRTTGVTGLFQPTSTLPCSARGAIVSFAWVEVDDVQHIGAEFQAPTNRRGFWWKGTEIVRRRSLRRA